MRPSYHAVDTCAAEFAALTPYYYAGFESEDEFARDDRASIVVLGSGPNRIGQGIEFDYCCVHAAETARELGYASVMVNCNPETVSTDHGVSDRLYLEPVTVDSVLDICAAEKPLGVVAQLGGQTPLRLARTLVEAGVPVLGTSPDAIDLAEDRGRFGALLADLGLEAPPWAVAATGDEALAAAAEIGYPVLVRPSYVLGGRAMAICDSPNALRGYLELERPSGILLVDRFLENAIELDVDALSDGTDCWTAAVMEHVEAAGVHSGDSACVLPAQSVGPGAGGRPRGADRGARQGARRRRPAERPVRGPRGPGLRHRGQPARLAHGAVRLQGDRGPPGAARAAPDARRLARRARAAGRRAAAAGGGQGGRAALLPLPRAPTPCSVRRCARPVR